MHSSTQSASAAASTPAEKPQNGVAGLKHWRHDLLAGLVVSLVSLPLSSGIAIASGAPPIYGIISSIIAGLVFPFVGGSYVTIAGPAAGLAPALMATMVALGGAGDADQVGVGYHRLLVVIFLVGIAQVILSKLKLARYAAIFPAAVVEGMLGAIGLLILVKALPLWLGVLEPVHAHSFFEYLGEIPHLLAAADPFATAIGVASLVVMLVAVSKPLQRFKVFRTVPPHIFGVALGVPAALLVGLAARDARFLIEVPANPLSGITMPAFGDFIADPGLWQAAIVGIVTLTLIDGVESLATAQAIDRIDPFKRQSHPDQLLQAMGISNIVSSLLGGLTIIPGGVKSKTCIEAGGRTLWANFANAVFLLGFLFVAPALISLIPKATLGAILVYTGWKMMHPSIARHLAHVGREQVALYGATILAILATDLLVGVLIGTVIKGAMVLTYAMRADHRAGRDQGVSAMARELLSDPVTGVRVDGSTAHLAVTGPLVCFNSFRVDEHLAALPGGVHDIHIHLGPGVAMVDHTSTDRTLTLAKSLPGICVTVHGLNEMPRVSAHERALRVQTPTRLATATLVGAAAASALLGQIPGESTFTEVIEQVESEESKRRHT